MNENLFNAFDLKRKPVLYFLFDFIEGKRKIGSRKINTFYPCDVPNILFLNKSTLISFSKIND